MTFPEEGRFWYHKPTTPIVSLCIFQHRRGIAPIDFNCFIEIAYGSLLESVSELKIAHTQKFVRETGFEPISEQAEELAKMLNGLSA